MTTAFAGIHFFNSDEISERIAELKDLHDAHQEAGQGDLFTMSYSDAERAEHEELCAFEAQCEDLVSDWKYGAQFIHEDAFHDHIVQETQELYPDLLGGQNTYPHRYLTMDWDALVQANLQDYTAYTLDGNTYYVRN